MESFALVQLESKHDIKRCRSLLYSKGFVLARVNAYKLSSCFKWVINRYGRDGVYIVTKTFTREISHIPPLVELLVNTPIFQPIVMIHGGYLFTREALLRSLYLSEAPSNSLRVSLIATVYKPLLLISIIVRELHVTVKDLGI